MSLRTKVQRLLRRDPMEHQMHRLALAGMLVPQDVQDAVRAVLNGTSERYQERVDRECARLSPALEAWAQQLHRSCRDIHVPGGPDDPIPDDVWNAPRLRNMPIPHAGAAVLQEARRAVRAYLSGPAADELERDALAACAHAGHLALNLTRSLAELEADADRTGVWD